MRPVRQCTIDGEYIATCKSAEEAGRQLGLSGRYIADCCYGVCNEAYGYKWEFVNPDPYNEKRFTVYLLIFPDNKVYVGKTSRKPEYRFGHNGSGYIKQAVYAAIEQFGWQNIEKRIVATCQSGSDAAKLEKQYIAQYHSDNPDFGYNLTRGGDGRSDNRTVREKEAVAKYNRERLVTDEMRAKNSASQKRNIQTSGIVPFKGQHHSDHTKQVLSQKAKKRFETEPGTFTGRHHGDEAKAKISKIHKGTKLSPEHKQKISNANKGHPVSEETRAIMRQKSSGKNNGMYGKHGANNPNSKPVLQYDKGGNFIAVYESCHDASVATGVDAGSIGDCAKGKKASAGGYVWVYKKR